MRRRSVKITTLIILLSFITVLLQFGFYYFIENQFWVLSISILLIFFISHLLLEFSLSHEACFLYTLFIVLLSTLFSFLIHWSQIRSLLVYKGYLPYLIFLNWLIPLGYCILRSLFDRGPRYVEFPAFFKKTSLLFIVFYLGLLFYNFFANPISLNANLLNEEGISLKPALLYCLKHIILSLPYGFYIGLLFRKSSFVKKFLLFLVFPLLIELLQYIFQVGRLDFDDFFFSLLGVLVGSILYKILNHTFIAITEEEFLYKRNPYSFFLRNLY